jgi:predicted lipid-binding transport protein (Tim44 family)
MIYLALGAAALWFLVGLGRGQTVFKRREWRIFSGALSVAAFAGAAFAGLRGAWEISIILLILGLWTVTTARINAARAPRQPPLSSKMTDQDARSLLGVGPDATAEEIPAAYTRLMRMAHPDKGGTTGLATQLNAARDRLLKD